MSADDYPDQRKPKIYYFNRSRHEPTVIAAPPKPDYGVVTPDFGEWRGRYFVPTMPINTQRGDRADDWMVRMRSYGAPPRETSK